MPACMLFSELREKEVINVSDGACLGHVIDAEFDRCDGRLVSLVVPGRARCFGLVRASEDFFIPYCGIKKIGEDVILVEIPL